uniref:Uncharacterized protein n=1 Tax=Panagrolaimus sp. ES5 TaxID=591445 RepID=A0AC34GHK6_9BILA
MSEKKSTIEDDSASVSSALPASSETEHGCFGDSDEADEPPVNEKHKDESDKSVISQSSASSSLNEEVENDATVASEIIVAKADIPVEVTDATKATTVEAPIVQATVAEEGVNKVTSTLMNTDVEFYYPSSMDLKKCCEKFGVVYNRNAYAFWSNFEIGKISSTSIPDKLYSSANNGFVSLSLYLTGSEENASKIKETLNK